MIDCSKVGYQFKEYTADVEPWRLRFFAKSIGETDPIYFEQAAAQAAGYRDILAPPTFAFSLDMDAPEPLPVLKVLGLDIATILHSRQSFEYFGEICAGDRITVRSKISDIVSKRGGALAFVTISNDYVNQLGETVVRATSSLVHRARAETKTKEKQKQRGVHESNA